MTPSTTSEAWPGPGDRRLDRAFRLFESHELSVLSLDVFDTLVWRTVPEPVDAFLLLGRRLQDLQVLAPHVPIQLFARLREQAERRARSRVPQGRVPEVSIEAVYEEMPAHLFTADPTPEDLAGHEVALEHDIVFPDLEIVRLARCAQDRYGMSVVLVSDTYFSPSQLRRVVDCEALADLALTEVFTSSRHQVNKSTGLFDVVLDTMKVQPERIVHVGDHPESDIAAADRAGIHAIGFEKLTEPIHEVLRREKVVRTADRDTTIAPVDDRWGDLGLTALRAKSVHLGTGPGATGPTGEYWRFGSTVLGPAFTGFAEWVHRRAQDEGVSTVYCLMREGEFLSRLVNGARRHLDSQVTAVPLWLSRSVCARASIFDASEQELAGFVHRRSPPTVREFCLALGVAPALVPELFDQVDGRLDEPQLRQHTLAVLAGQPEVRAAIVAESTELRRRLVDYVLKTVGPDRTPMVVVDLGWGGTIQGYLDQALAGAGAAVETIGLYLLTNETAGERILDGVHAEGFLASGGLPERSVRWVIRSPEIIEQICMHDEGSLQGFTEEAEPVRGPGGQSPVQMLQRSAVQRGILGFQQLWSDYAEVIPASQRVLDGHARDLLLRMVLRFVVAPTTEEASMFGTWFHDEGFGSAGDEQVVVAELARSLRYMTPRQFLDLPMTRVYWPFGLAAMHNSPIAAAAAAVGAGVLWPHEVSGDQEGEAHVFVDLGAGFAPHEGRTVRVRGTGLRFVRDEIAAGPLHGVQIQLGEGPGAARVDSLRLVFSLRGQALPVVVSIEWPEEFSQVHFEDAAMVSPNVAFGARRSPALVYRCPSRWGLDVYKVELELTYAWLPLATVANARAPRAAVALEVGRRVEGRLRRLWSAAEQVAGERTSPMPGS